MYRWKYDHFRWNKTPTRISIMQNGSGLRSCVPLKRQPPLLLLITRFTAITLTVIKYSSIIEIVSLYESIKIYCYRSSIVSKGIADRHWNSLYFSVSLYVIFPFEEIFHSTKKLIECFNYFDNYFNFLSRRSIYYLVYHIVFQFVHFSFSTRSYNF